MLTIEQAETRITNEVKPQSRSISRTWHLDNVTLTTQWGDTYHSALHLYVFHDKDRKRFVANISRVGISPKVWSTVIDYGKGHPVPNFVVSYADRYSAKALQAAFNEALPVIEENMPALLEWAAGAAEEVA
jgi:hypothetical protein